MKVFSFVSHLEYPLFVVIMFNRNCLFRFTRILKYVLCSSHTLIVFLTCTHIRRNSLLLKHSFQQLCVTVHCILAKKKTEYVDTKVNSETCPLIKQGYEFSYELLPGRNVLKQKLIESCKNDLYIDPCNQETNTIVLICSTFILVDSST